MDKQDYEKKQAGIILANELAKGKKSGEEKGWLPSDDVKNSFIEKQREG